MEHVLPCCSLREILALGHTTSALRQLVASLPESALRAAAQRSLLPTHPVCLSNNVRGAPLRQHQLETGMLQPRTWRMGERRSCFANSPDYRLIAVCEGYMGNKIQVQDAASMCVIRQARLPVPHPPEKLTPEMRFSPDSRNLAILFCSSIYANGGVLSSVVQVALLPLGTPTAALRVLEVGHLPPYYSSSWADISWAPCGTKFYGTLFETRCLSTMLHIFSALGDRLLSCVTSHRLVSASWSPRSHFLLSCMKEGLWHLVNVVTGEWHAHSLGEVTSWLPRSSSSKEWLVSADGHSVSLRAAPKLKVIHTQRVPVRVGRCICGPDVVVLKDSLCRHALVYSVLSPPYADGRFLQLLRSVPAAFAFLQPAASPTGRIVAVTVRDQEGQRLELLSLHAGAARLGSIAIPSRIGGNMKWSSDASSVLIDPGHLVSFSG